MPRSLTLEIRRPGVPVRRRRIPPARIRGWLRHFAGRRVAVVGDAILDSFLWGDATRISPEAPVPVVLLDRQTWSLGGAANVAANIAALGGEAVLFTSIGDDLSGDRLIELMDRGGLPTTGVQRLRGRVTTVKNRVFARNKHLLRFDNEDPAPVPPAADRDLVRRLHSAGPFDAVVISDYAKGCVSASLVRAVEAYCVDHALKLCVDPKSTALRYPHAWVLKPNLAELEALSGLRIRDEAELLTAARRTLRQQQCAHLLVTRGAQGMILVGRDQSQVLLSAGGQQVSDVTGAGDTVTATLALAIASGVDLPEAALLANLAAGYVVSQPGIAVVRPQDLLAAAGQ